MIQEMTHVSTSPGLGSSYLFSPMAMESLHSNPWRNSHHHRHPQESGLGSPPEPAIPEYDDYPSSQMTLEAAAYPRDLPPSASQTTAASCKKKLRKASKASKSSYKHVPHREKPPHLVARRNARERRRVQAVNTAFARLRKCIPSETRNKRLSKVKTLHRAIEYIQTLQEVLSNADEELNAGDSSLRAINDFLESQVSSLNKENEMGHRWIPITNWENETHSSCLSFYDDFSDQMQS